MFLKSGHEVNHLTGKELEELSEGFQCRKHGLIRLDPGGWIHYSTFLNVADRIYDFKFRQSDVIIMTHPKAGTTWMQEIAWTIRNNLFFDHPRADVMMNLRSPFLEMDQIIALPSFGELPPENVFLKRFNELCPNGNSENEIVLQVAECEPDPRTIKTHLSFPLLPQSVLTTSKIIYVARNPMDTCVSAYHFDSLDKTHSYTGGLERYLDLFIEGRLNWSPYWTHLKEAWQRRRHPNLLFCFYEDMKKNPRENLLKVSEFLDIKLNEDQMEKVLHHTSFDSMKARGVFWGETDDKCPFVIDHVYQKDGGFFRKGISGGWKTELTGEQAERIKVWSLHHLKDFEESETFISKWF